MVAVRADDFLSFNTNGIASLILGQIWTEENTVGFYMQVVPSNAFQGRRVGWLAPAVRTLPSPVLNVEIASFPVISASYCGYVFDQSLAGSNSQFVFYPRPFLGNYTLIWGRLFYDP